VSKPITAIASWVVHMQPGPVQLPEANLGAEAFRASLNIR
jgi:hypothetical protein